MNKFPVNNAQVKGMICNYLDNPVNKRISFAVRTYAGQNAAKEPQYKFINVSIPPTKYEEFKKNMDKFQEIQGDKKNPLVQISGVAQFKQNTAANGVVHQNISIVANGDMSQKNERFNFPVTDQELDAFKKQNTVTNSNSIQIRANLAADPVIHTNKTTGQNFANISIAHNYTDQQENKKVMFANVVIPTSEMHQLKTASFEKGTPIFLTGTMQPKDRKNDSGQSVYEFKIITKHLALDSSKNITTKKAAEAVMEVAGITQKGERQKAAEKAIEGIQPKKSKDKDTGLSK